jgi:xylulokinase
MRVLAIDVGTSSLKAGIIDREGCLRSSARERLLDRKGADLSRFRPGIWFEALRDALKSLGPELSSVKAVSVSGNGPTLVSVGGGGEAQEEAFLWIDERRSYKPGEASFFLPKASWILKNRPKLYERTETFLGCPEYLSFLLSGTASAFSPSEEFDQYFWNEASLSSYGLDRGKFPPFARTGDLVGRVTRAASEATAVPEGIPLFAGGSDFLMALLGTGAVSPGSTCDRAGSSEGINYCSPDKVRHERIRCLPHVIPGLYNASGILASTGTIFEWFRKFSGQTEVPYDEMLGRIRDLGHKASIPSFFPSVRRGAVWQFSGGIFSGLEDFHGKDEMGRAVVNAIGFGVRDCVDTLASCGCTVSELVVSGGQALSPVWNQMKADMAGCPVAVPEIADGELTGAACSAFTGLGEFTDLIEASRSLVRLRARFTPRPGEERLYTEEYGRYRYLCDRIHSAVAEDTAGS